MKYSTLSAVFIVSFINQAFSACVTDGGYADQGTPCASDCFSFPLNAEIPYIGPNTPPTDPIEAVNDTFCTTVPFSDYDPTIPPDRKFWGFCLCTSEATLTPTSAPIVSETPETTLSPTIGESSEEKFEEVWFADGGGVGLTHPENVDEDGYQDCFLPFTYIALDGSQQTVESCASIDVLPPFLGSGNDFPYSPSNPQTNTSLWCPINSAVYDFDPPSEQIKERKDWGYCLLTLRAIVTTSSPTPQTTTTTSSSPTVLPTSLSPTVLPTSLSPTSLDSTGSPTSFPNDPYFDDDDNETGSKPPGTDGGSSGSKASFGLVSTTLILLALTQAIRN